MKQNWRDIPAEIAFSAGPSFSVRLPQHRELVPTDIRAAERYLRTCHTCCGCPEVPDHLRSEVWHFPCIWHGFSRGSPSLMQKKGLFFWEPAGSLLPGPGNYSMQHRAALSERTASHLVHKARSWFCQVMGSHALGYPPLPLCWWPSRIASCPFCLLQPQCGHCAPQMHTCPSPISPSVFFKILPVLLLLPIFRVDNLKKTGWDTCPALGSLSGCYLTTRNKHEWNTMWLVGL